MPEPLQKQLRFAQSGNEILAVLSVVLPSGERKEYTAALGADEISRFAASLDRGDSIEGRALVRRVQEIGVDAPDAPDWWWRAAAAKALGFDPNDKSARAVKARSDWWMAKSADRREYDRALYLGVRAWGLQNNPAKGLAELQRVGKKGRERIHHRYRRGPWDAGRVAKDVGKVALDVAPLVLMAVPGIGPVVGPALMLAKQLASAKVLDVAGKALSGITGKPDHKKAGVELAATARLVGADVALKSGAPKTAARLIDRAKKQAPADVLKLANVTRANIGRVAEKPDVLALARAGQLRSSKGGNVTPAELLAASKSGRVFFVSSAA